LVSVNIANTSLERNRWFVFGLPEIAKAYRPDIVHFGFPIPVIGSRFSCPVVVTVHDLYPYDYSESFGHLDGFCKRRFFEQCMKRCDAVISVSESTRSALTRRFPRLSSRVPVRVVYNYADFEPFAESPAGNQRPFLLTVAQHQPNKRLDLLLEAFARLRISGRISHEFELLVVGSEGSQSESLRKLARALNLDACVHWLPPVSDRRLAWLYQSCQAFVASSCIEGFCLPLLEALFFNCRTVASDIPVFHEIAGEIPVYFDIAHDPVNGLASAIVRSLSRAPSGQPDKPHFSRGNTASECFSLYSLLLSSATEERQHLSAAGSLD
jgi:glycosyltransferase involved in cell wall biosynthesis